MYNIEWMEDRPEDHVFNDPLPRDHIGDQEPIEHPFKKQYRQDDKERDYAGEALTLRVLQSRRHERDQEAVHEGAHAEACQ